MVGASIVMVTVVCALVLGTYSLRGQMQTIFSHMPEAVGKVSTGLASQLDGHNGNMQKIQSAARDMEKATSPAADLPLSAEKGATRVVVDAPAF